MFRIDRGFINGFFRVLLWVCFLGSGHVSATENGSKKDSLFGIWGNTKLPDSTRLSALHNYTYSYYAFSNKDSALVLLNLEYEFAAARGLKKEMGNALVLMGDVYENLGNFPKALDVLIEGNQLFEEIQNKQGKASALFKIGEIFSLQGNYVKAIDHFMRSLKLREEMGSEAGIAACLFGIGHLNLEQGDPVKAFEQFERAYEIKKKLGDKSGMAIGLGNLGLAAIEQGDYVLGIDFLSQNLEIVTELGNEFAISTTLNNIGVSYKDLGDLDLALDFFERSLGMREKLGFKMGVARSLSNIGDVYFEKGQLNKALNYCSRAYLIAKESGQIYLLTDITWSLWEINKKLGNYKLALEMHELFIGYRDSVKSEENNTEMMRQEFKYNYEKKTVADSIQNAESKKVIEAQLFAQEEQIAREKLQRNSLYGGMSLLVVFGIIMFNRFRVTNRQKIIIQEKERQTNFQNIEITAQKESIEQKNMEILDSIVYAKRIQQSILPDIGEVKRTFSDSFILFLPKDVVSGDFYWFEKFDGMIYLAAADCTGHGVPGAMVSVLCHHALHKALVEEGVKEVGMLLGRTRELLIEQLERSNEDLKDGMDISLVSLKMIEREQNTEGDIIMEWSGANNPLWIVRNGELFEYKPNKQPVGKYIDAKPFNTSTIVVKPGDCFYLFTDGLQDQFGGEKGKKLKPANVKKKLIDIAHLPMSEQQDLLHNMFLQWKNKHEQVDDICILGVRI